MEAIKSLDEVELIATLLHDISMMHGDVFNTRACRLTIEKVRRRCLLEGLGFLTKTLPKLGRAFDKALSDYEPLDSIKLGFAALPDSKLPRFLGEFFQKVLNSDGRLLSNPCATAVEIIRQVTCLFGKYELPYTVDLEQRVLDQFVKAERELSEMDAHFAFLQSELSKIATSRRRSGPCRTVLEVAREARILLSRVFRDFNPLEILPRHGPGAVATRQLRSQKYAWTNISARLANVYPLDAYFYASLGHVCDRYRSLSELGVEDYPARVILVPKDSRGPRLISAEPVDFQWIQQGLRAVVYRLVESHPLTRNDVYFTDQVPNRVGALLGSSTGKYATLDLKEASDRVHLDLVRMLFPAHVYEAFEAARTRQTQLPSGELISLKKFAPMGSALCFPVLALTIWALLKSGLCDDILHIEKYEDMHVYGDDVIVPTAQAVRAISILESFGLKVNRDKSCTSGLFRESCGMDAFNGFQVTPIRIRTVWASKPSANVYTSWLETANSFYDKRCFSVYEYIVQQMLLVYGNIPGEELVGKRAPSLRETPINGGRFRYRTHKDWQSRQILVRVAKPVKSIEEIDGWSMLLRYFTEGSSPTNPVQECVDASLRSIEGKSPLNFIDPEADMAFSVRSYTKRKTSMLVFRWR